MKSFLRYLYARFFQKRVFKEVSFFSRELERRKFLFIQHVVQKGDLVLDVGAHAGLFSHLFATLVGKEGKILAFEPNPFVFAILKKWSRKKKAVHPLQIAVSDGSKQEIELAVHPFSMAALSTVEPTLMSKERMPGWKKKVRVKAASLDELTKSCTQKVRLIKLDVEGHEESVFKGATQLLENDSPFLIFEYGIEPSHFEPQTIEWLQKKNYVCFDLMTLQKMEQAPKAAYFTDIVAIPEKKLSEIKPLLDALAYVMRARTS